MRPWLVALAFLALLPSVSALADPPLVGTSPAAPSIENDDERAAFKAGRMFVFTTGNNNVATNPGIQVAANNFLNIRMCNTSATRTWYIASFGRFIDSTSTVETEYYGAGNTDAFTVGSATAATLSAGNTSSGTGLKPGTSQSDITFTFGVGSAMTCGGGGTCVPSGNGLIYPSQKNEISKPRALPPNTCFGQALVGQSTGGGLVTTPAAIYLIYRVYMYYDQ